MITAVRLATWPVPCVSADVSQRMMCPVPDVVDPSEAMQRPRWPRLLAAAGLVVILVLGLALVAAFDRVPRDHVESVPPGRLTVEPAAVGSWWVGDVEVSLDDAGLRIVDTARDDLVVFESPPQSPFVAAVLGDVAWTEHRGYFWPDTRHWCDLVDQQVRSVSDDGGRLQLSGVLTGCDQIREFSIDVRPGPELGDVALDVAARSVDALALVSGRTSGAGVHGFGEQFASFDLSGRVIPIVVREQGVGRGEQPLTVLADLTNRGAGGTDQMTYAAWPSFVTGDVRGVALDPSNAESHSFAVADTRRADRVVLTSWASQVRAVLTADTDPTALLARRAAPSPRPPLADWVQGGAVLGMQGGTEAVRRVVDEMTAAGTELSAVWLQDWSGRRVADLGDRLWWTWQLDAERYPDWDRLVDDLNTEGIRVLTYVNPFVVDADAKGDDTIRNLYREAEQKGYLVRDADGRTYLLDQGGFEAAMIDLTNPAARDWYAGVIASEVLGEGADGFMADFGEGLPFDAELAAGDPAVDHNRWPLLWSRVVEQACALAAKPDCLTWFRSGSAGMAEHAAMFWNGDQNVTDDRHDGLASALLGTFSAGVSGWPLVHSDVGGYTSIDAVARDYVRPDDLNARWAEMAAFSPMMRTHEGNRPGDNEQVYDTEATRAAFARMTRLFAALAPYRADVVAEAVERGVPAMRHGWLLYPGTEAAEADDQFFFGSSILVAPVLATGATSVDVTLPPGTWVHLLTGEEYDGDRVVTVEAPLGTPAAFTRADDERTDEIRALVDAAGL
jgi:sulfoquinovosidase